MFKLTPLRRNACIFAAHAGFDACEVKVKENRKANQPAWDVFVRPVGQKRGKCIGAMLAGAA